MRLKKEFESKWNINIKWKLYCIEIEIKFETADASFSFSTIFLILINVFHSLILNFLGNVPVCIKKLATRVTRIRAVGRSENRGWVRE